MSLFDLDENVFPVIFQFVDRQTLPFLPLVSKAFRRQCRYVEVAWDLADYPERVQASLMSAPREGSLLTFLGFRVTKLSLRNWGIHVSSDVVAIVSKVPHLRHLDMRRCHCMRQTEWDLFIDTLEHRRGGYLERLQNFDTPYFRVEYDDGAFTSADVLWMKGFIAVEEELTDTDSEDDYLLELQLN